MSGQKKSFCTSDGKMEFPGLREISNRWSDIHKYGRIGCIILFLVRLYNFDEHCNTTNKSQLNIVCDFYPRGLTFLHMYLLKKKLFIAWIKRHIVSVTSDANLMTLIQYILVGVYCNVQCTCTFMTRFIAREINDSIVNILYILNTDISR